MKKEQKEKIAISAANTWCRCFKCDGKVNTTGYTCDQDKKLTCHKWYDGYRTAMLALSEYEQQIMKDSMDGVITFDYYKDDKTYGCVAHDSFCLEDRGLRDCDNVKIIVTKKKEV